MCKQFLCVLKFPKRKYTVQHVVTSAQNHGNENEVISRRYHVYKTIWNAILGEILKFRRDRDNEKDWYAAGVFQNEVLVGHLPKKYSRVCAIFFDKGGQIHCTVVGRRQYSSDLVQGGLEIPCSLTFTSSKATIKKLAKFL